MKNVKELLNLSGKTAVITGGLGHLGFAMTQSLLELGATVVVTTVEGEVKNPEISAKLEVLKNNYPKEQFSVEVIDFFNQASLKKLFTNVSKKYHRLDMLINNALAGIQKPLEEMSLDEFNHSVQGALGSVYACSTLAVPLMKKSGGSIINIASMYGLVSPDPRVYVGTKFNSTPSYGPAKAGIIQLTKYLAAYWAQYHIRVNSISPGPFPNTVNVKDKKFLSRLKEKTMLGRLGTPEDLKGVIALLSSDASNYITGQNIIIDGGWTAW